MIAYLPSGASILNSHRVALNVIPAGKVGHYAVVCGSRSETERLLRKGKDPAKCSSGHLTLEKNTKCLRGPGGTRITVLGKVDSLLDISDRFHHKVV